MRRLVNRLLLGVGALGVGGSIGYFSGPAPGSPRAITRDEAGIITGPASSGSARGAEPQTSSRPGAPLRSDGPTQAQPAPRRDMLEVFEHEARDPAFAPRREAFLRRAYGGVLARVAPGVSIDDLECKTSTCVIALSLPDDPWAHDVVSWLPWGDRRRTTDVAGEDARVAVEVVATYSSESLAHDYFEQAAADVLHRIEVGLVELHAQRLADAGVE